MTDPDDKFPPESPPPPRSTALERLNEVRLLSHLQDKLKELTKHMIGDPMDRVTVERFRHEVANNLNEFVQRRVIRDYNFTDLNTPESIDRGEINFSIEIQPTDVIESVRLKMSCNVTGEVIDAEITVPDDEEV